MTLSPDQKLHARALRDAISELEPSKLEPRTFARIADRRARGERIALLTSDAPIALIQHRPFQLAAILSVAAATLLIALSLSNKHMGVSDTTAAPDEMALAPVDAACAAYPASRDSSTLRHLMVSAFGVAAACGAEPEPSSPLAVDPSQIAPGSYTYGGLTITDRLHTSIHAPTTITISKSVWRGIAALIAVRDGPLITRVSVDSLTVSARDLTPLHWASWYPTQKPVGSLHADFDSNSVTITMKGRVDTVGTFPYAQASGRLPQEWLHYLVVPSLPLIDGWRGTIQVAPPIHPHVHKYFTTGWATMALRVVGREKITVAAGSFDCWKLQLGDGRDSSYMWVSAKNHLVVRSESIHHFDDTEFDDRVDLQQAIYSSQ